MKIPISLLSLSLLTCICLSGCGLANSYYINYNARPQAILVSNVGSPMLLVENYCKNDVYDRVFARFVQELDYTGKQGSIIKIYYKEFSEGWARPAFTQELTYDLSTSDTIQFKETKIKIIEANNNLIKFEVLETPAYQNPPNAKIDSLSSRCTDVHFEIMNR